MRKANRERILVAEDEPDVRNYLELSLRCHGYDVEQAENGEEVLRLLNGSESGVSLVLLDIMMPFKDGIETLREIRVSHRDLPVIMLSGGAAPSTIVETMKCGADDYLTKPASQEQLLCAIERTLAKRGAAGAFPVRERAKSRIPLAPNPSSWMRKIEPMIRRVAVSEAPVLLQGETGTGKEVLARALHAASARAANPFLKVNCAALPSELVESELFGYERGAFTGATKSKPGKFDMAQGGTIFLDEIGDMDFRLQAKLLQVLQDHEFQRLGGKETIRVDVRVMAATHSDLEKSIQERRFREDLYYRLNVINIMVPALRERPDEIMPLARHFLQKHSVADGAPLQITPLLSDALTNYDWPGNVRELENVVRRCLALHDTESVAEDLRLRSRHNNHVSAPAPQPTRVEAPPVRVSAPTLKNVAEAQRQAEIDAIQSVLNRTRWNRKQAAGLLHIDYKALLYKMKKLGIDREGAELTAPEMQ
jgi:two-component system response regulator AtoC